MIRILKEEERRQMTRDEIERIYDGKWIFMINVILEPFSAVPVVIADEWWEDRESGVYESFKSNIDNGATMHLSLLKSHTDMLGHF